MTKRLNGEFQKFYDDFLGKAGWRPMLDEGIGFYVTLEAGFTYYIRYLASDPDGYLLACSCLVPEKHVQQITWKLALLGNKRLICLFQTQEKTFPITILEPI